MKIKNASIILIFILLICLFTTTIYAADEVEVKLEPDKNTLEAGDEVIVKVSIANNNSQNEIYEIFGYLEYDTEIFELVLVEEMDEEQELIVQGLADEGIELDIISLKDNWLIGVMEDEEETEKNILYAVYLSETGGIEQGQTSIIGEIKFNVIDSAKAGTSSIKMYELAANEEISVSDISTSEIIIVNTKALDENEDNKQEQAKEEKEEETTKENSQKEANESQKELANTGTEDVIPYIFTAMLVVVISYVRWNKYKQI